LNLLKQRRNHVLKSPFVGKEVFGEECPTVFRRILNESPELGVAELRWQSLDGPECRNEKQ
jgi:hypothetical protein